MKSPEEIAFEIVAAAHLNPEKYTLQSNITKALQAEREESERYRIALCQIEGSMAIDHIDAIKRKALGE